jgi:hypothetical protein
LERVVYLEDADAELHCVPDVLDLAQPSQPKHKLLLLLIPLSQPLQNCVIDGLSFLKGLGLAEVTEDEAVDFLVCAQSLFETTGEKRDIFCTMNGGKYFGAWRSLLD